MFKDVIDFIKGLYPEQKNVQLHIPRFLGNEKKYLCDCIDSTYVSYVGDYVNKFEQSIQDFTGAKYAISTVNGTCALHTALILSNINRNDEVITQPLTFVATVNSIKYCNANPIFLDVDKKTMGLSAEKLNDFLKNNIEIKKDSYSYNKSTGNRIRGCIPAHIFGHPVEIDKIVEICSKYNILVIEDAAESLGSFYKARHTGTFGKMGILSFNGNKIVTTGGGGMILTDDHEIAKKAKHLTTTAKVVHKWEYIHDNIGYNYRMPNVNAAIGFAQMELLQEFIKKKRKLAQVYNDFFKNKDIDFVMEQPNSKANYWLNTIILKDRKQRDTFLKYSNSNGVMTRPVWRLMNKLYMYRDCYVDNIDNSIWLEDRLVNIPSSVSLSKIF